MVSTYGPNAVSPLIAIMSGLFCTQEEADTRLLFHSFHSLHYGRCNFETVILMFSSFEICLVVFLDLIDIYTDTKITKIGAFIAKLQALSVFRAAILNFFSGKPRATIWFPPFLDSAYSKTPRRKFLCFYPEVHAKFTYPPH